MGRYDIGKKVEKNIRYNPKVDTYYVLFNFRSINELKSFSTLEDARAYRDAINAEKLRVKTQESIAKLKAYEDAEIAKELEAEPYPFNVLKAAMVPGDRIPFDLTVEDTFNEEIVDILSTRELFAIKGYYTGSTLAEVGKEFGVTRERVRQIIARALRKIKLLVLNYEQIQDKKHKQEQEQKLAEDLHQQREKLIEVFREKGVIDNEMTAYFGDVMFGCKEEECEAFLKKTSIAELEISVRTYNALRNVGIQTLYDLMQLDEHVIINIRGLGKKSYEELRKCVNKLGFHFIEEGEYYK